MVLRLAVNQVILVRFQATQPNLFRSRLMAGPWALTPKMLVRFQTSGAKIIPDWCNGSTLRSERRDLYGSIPRSGTNLFSII